MTAKKSGGKRQGSGRKRVLVKRIGFSVWIRPDCKERIQTIAASQGIKPSALIERWADSRFD